MLMLERSKKNIVTVNFPGKGIGLETLFFSLGPMTCSTRLFALSDLDQIASQSPTSPDFVVFERF